MTDVDEAMEIVRMDVMARLGRAADVLVRKHRERLGVPNPAPHLNSSRPGEFPRERTGNLLADVTIERDATEVRVGHTSAAPYNVPLAMSGRLTLGETAMQVRSELAAAVEEDA